MPTSARSRSAPARPTCRSGLDAAGAGRSREFGHLTGDIGTRTRFPKGSQLLRAVDPLAGQKDLKHAPTPRPIRLLRNMGVLTPDRLRIGMIFGRCHRQDRQVEVEQQ